MAVDTRAKRLSMLNFGGGGLLPDPSGTVDAAARATLLNLYSGIALFSPAVTFPRQYQIKLGCLSNEILIRGNNAVDLTCIGLEVDVE